MVKRIFFKQNFSKTCFGFRFQTNQLRNISKDYCAIVNCYRYDDNIQWNEFDFINHRNGLNGNFLPNTDFSFGEMREKVLTEFQSSQLENKFYFSH